MNDKQNKSLEYWNKIFLNFDKKDIMTDNWLDTFKDKVQNVDTPIIDLGCGMGNNILYLINMNKKVIACDQSINAINNIKKIFKNVDTMCFNMLDDLPFKDNSCDLIIADLSLHYFKWKDTIKIINEIKRVLKNNGYLIFRVNSIKDKNHGSGSGAIIEKHLYMTNDGLLKRFFDEEDIYRFFKDFDIEYLNEEVMTRYKLEKVLYKGCLKIRK